MVAFPTEYINHIENSKHEESALAMTKDRTKEVWKQFAWISSNTKDLPINLEFIEAFNALNSSDTTIVEIGFCDCDPISNHITPLDTANSIKLSQYATSILWLIKNVERKWEKWSKLDESISQDKGVLDFLEDSYFQLDMPYFIGNYVVEKRSGIVNWRGGFIISFGSKDRDGQIKDSYEMGLAESYLLVDKWKFGPFFYTSLEKTIRIRDRNIPINLNNAKVRNDINMLFPVDSLSEQYNNNTDSFFYDKLVYVANGVIITYENHKVVFHIGVTRYMSHSLWVLLDWTRMTSIDYSTDRAGTIKDLMNDLMIVLPELPIQYDDKEIADIFAQISQSDMENTERHYQLHITRDKDDVYTLSIVKYPQWYYGWVKEVLVSYKKK